MAKRTYSADEKQRALAEVERGSSISSAAFKCGIPRKTLADWVAGREESDEDDGDDGGTVAVAEAPSFQGVKESIFPEAGSCQDNPPPSLADATDTVTAPATDGFAQTLAANIQDASSPPPPPEPQPARWAMDPFDRYGGGLHLSYPGGSARALASLRFRLVGGDDPNVRGHAVALEQFTDRVRDRVKSNEHLHAYRRLMREFDSANATLADLEARIEAAEAAVADVRGVDLASDAAVLEHHRATLRAQQLRQQHETLLEAIQEAAPGLEDARERAIASAGGVVGAVRNELNIHFARQREEYRAKLDEVAGPLLAGLVEADCSWMKIPRADDVSLGSLVDHLATEADPPPAPAEAPAAAETPTTTTD